MSAIERLRQIEKQKEIVGGLSSLERLRTIEASKSLRPIKDPASEAKAAVADYLNYARGVPIEMTMGDYQSVAKSHGFGGTDPIADNEAVSNHVNGLLSRANEKRGISTTSGIGSLTGTHPKKPDNRPIEEILKDLLMPTVPMVEEESGKSEFKAQTFVDGFKQNIPHDIQFFKEEAVTGSKLAIRGAFSKGLNMALEGLFNFGDDQSGVIGGLYAEKNKKELDFALKLFGKKTKAGMLSKALSDSESLAIEGIQDNVQEGFKFMSSSQSQARDDINRVFPVTKGQEESLPGQITSGIGQGLSAIFVAPLPGGLPMHVSGLVYQEGREDYENTQKRLGRTIDPEERNKAGLMNLPAGALEFYADKFIINKILTPMRGKLKVSEIPEHIMKAGAAEGMTEGAQTFWLNLVASELHGYDADRELDEGVKHAIIVGAFTGQGLAAGGVATTAVFNRKNIINDAREISNIPLSPQEFEGRNRLISDEQERALHDAPDYAETQIRAKNGDPEAQAEIMEKMLDEDFELKRPQFEQFESPLEVIRSSTKEIEDSPTETEEKLFQSELQEQIGDIETSEANAVESSKAELKQSIDEVTANQEEFNNSLDAELQESIDSLISKEVKGHKFSEAESVILEDKLRASMGIKDRLSPKKKAKFEERVRGESKISKIKTASEKSKKRIDVKVKKLKNDMRVASEKSKKLHDAKVSKLKSNMKATLAKSKAKSAAKVHKLQTDIQGGKVKIEKQKASFRKNIAKIRIASKNEAKRIRADFKSKRLTLKQSITQLEALIQELPRGIRGDFKAFEKLSGKQSEAAQLKFLIKSSDKILDMIQTFETRTGIKGLESLISGGLKNKVTKAQFSKIAKAFGRNIDATQEFILSLEDEQGDSPEGYDPEVAEQIFLARVFGGVKELSAQASQARSSSSDVIDRIAKAAAEALFIATESKTTFQAKQEQQKEAHAKSIENSVENVLGDRARKTQQDINFDVQEESKFKKWFSKAFSAWDDLIQNAEGLLDKVAHDKSKANKGYLVTSFARKFRAANNARFDGITKNRDKLQDMLLNGLWKKRTPKQLKKTIEEMELVKSDTGIWVNKTQLKLSKWDAITLYMWSKDETLAPTFDKMGYSKETFSQLESFISEEGTFIGDWMLDFYQEYGKTISKAFKEIEGYDIETVLNYSPVFRQKEPDVDSPEFLKFHNPHHTAKNSSLKSRRNNTTPFKIRPAHDVFAQHITQMEHYIAWGSLSKQMTAVVTSDSFRLAVIQMNGVSAYNAIHKLFNDLISGGVQAQMFNGIVAKIRGNIVKSQIALRLPVFFKQLTSIPALGDTIPTTSFVKGMAHFWTAPKKHTKILMESVFIKDRISTGYDRDVAAGLKKQLPGEISGVSDLSDRAMFLTRLGDIGAIVQGGWAVYKHHQSEGKKAGLSDEEAHANAIEEFETAVARSQQSSRPEDLGSLQRSGTFASLFTLYMTAPSSYYRIEVNAIRNAMKGRMTKAQAIKTVGIYHFVLPNLFQLISNGVLFGFGEDAQDDELIRRHMRASLLGSFNGILIFGDGLEVALDIATGQDAWFAAQNSNPFIKGTTAIFEAVGRWLRMFSDDEVTEKDIETAINRTLEGAGTVTGLPFSPVGAQIKGIKSALSGDTEHPVQRFLGWSDYSTAEFKNKEDL